MAIETYPRITLRDAMDRLFEQAFVGMSGDEPRQTNGQRAQNYVRFPVNLYEDAEAYNVWALLPGADPAKIEVTATADTLIVDAEGAASPPEGWRVVHAEWQPARWRREMAMPGPVDADRAEVTFQNGVLRLRLPKPEAVRPRTIKVNVKSA